MATSAAERMRRHRAKLRDPAHLRASVIVELFEICMGKRPANPSKMRAIELFLLLDRQYVLGSSKVIGKKALDELRAQLPPAEDSVWATLLDPDETEH